MTPSTSASARASGALRGPATEPADPRSPADLSADEDRELVIEIALDRPIDWDPRGAEVVWGDGTRLAATIDARLTTRSGRFAAGLLIRLDLRLDGDGPPAAPAEVLVIPAGPRR